MAKRRRTRSKKQIRSNRRLRSSRPLRRSVPAKPIQQSPTWRVSRPTVRRTVKQVKTAKPKKAKFLRSTVLTKTEQYRKMVCTKRRIRDQVMHAFKQTGKAGQKRPRHNQERAIKCN
jgi:hypothetical protein